MSRLHYPRVWAAALCSVLLVAASAAHADGPKVVASIKPVHSLIAGVMAGVGTPAILISGGASPHAYSLRPSDARLLSTADLIFWIGESMETFLAKPLKSLGGKAVIIKLRNAEGVRLLKSREGGTWEGHDHEDAGHQAGRNDPQSEYAHDIYNMHIWLGRDNAKAIVHAAAKALSDKDPVHAAQYRQNAQKTAARIESTFRLIHAQLAPVRRAPYLVFHDAYPYFERDHGLNAAGSISTHEAQKPGAKRIYEIRRKILSHNIWCVFAEPQFEPALVKTMIEGTSARSGILDPLGATLGAGPDAYFQLLQGFAKSLKECLAHTS